MTQTITRSCAKLSNNAMHARQAACEQLRAKGLPGGNSDVVGCSMLFLILLAEVTEVVFV